MSSQDSSDLRFSDLLATAVSSLTEIDRYQGEPDDTEAEIVSDLLWAMWDLHDALNQGLAQIPDEEVTATPYEAQAMNELMVSIYDVSYYGEQRGLDWVRGQIAALKAKAEAFVNVERHRASLSYLGGA